eukprot:355754-Chlamydomonas_euryale.AAC.22
MVKGEQTDSDLNYSITYTAACFLTTVSLLQSRMQFAEAQKKRNCRIKAQRGRDVPTKDLN